MQKHMTVKAFIARLARFPENTLCCGTFWLADDFLSLDDTLSPDDVAALEVAHTKKLLFLAGN
ncbi:hypothetical protein SAMN05216516_11531 [Izhakiella capsodis]|uniref:Uncharacterized protein n=1 Tax=Izhakiella capsodis TaxID=1367852 RepID=A0A1I5B9E7_9GAMM|nr:hypothetical protein [Izhakiella capsodis]SFN71307.1 hypothetical protein SAMN05216516_11531 [Izhakiella capsodis]